MRGRLGRGRGSGAYVNGVIEGQPGVPRERVNVGSGRDPARLPTFGMK